MITAIQLKVHETSVPIVWNIFLLFSHKLKAKKRKPGTLQHETTSTAWLQCAQRKCEQCSNLCQLEIDGTVYFHHLFQVGHFPSTIVTLLHNLTVTHTSIPIGCSGLVVSASDCGVRGPQFQSHHGRLCLSRQLVWHTALGTGYTPLLQCLGRLSLPPFVGR